jgi:ACR3 family arsenite transporter
VVGVLIEVPVMLSVVAVVNASKAWYERGKAVHARAASVLPDQG